MVAERDQQHAASGRSDDFPAPLTGLVKEAADDFPDLLNMRVSRHWWAMALRGALALVLGVLVLAWAPVTLLALVLLFGVYCILDAVFSAMLAVRGARHGGRWGLLAFNALLGLIAGGIAIFYPGVTLLVSAVLLGAWALLSGALSIAAAFRLRRDHGRVWMIIGGAAAVVLGIFALLFPLLALFWIVWLIAIQAFFVGFSLLALSLRLRNRKRLWPQRPLAV
jgi:uncharacterized membrane protein HdeD (DUF308 family)